MALDLCHKHILYLYLYLYLVQGSAQCATLRTDGALPTRRTDGALPEDAASFGCDVEAHVSGALLLALRQVLSRYLPQRRGEHRCSPRRRRRGRRTRGVGAARRLRMEVLTDAAECFAGMPHSTAEATRATYAAAISAVLHAEADLPSG